MDHHRPVADRAVDHRCRQVLVAKHPGLPAGAQNNGHLRLCNRMGAQRRDQLRLVGHIVKRRRRSDVDPAGQQVNMGVLKAGQNQPPARVDPVWCIGRDAVPQGCDLAALQQDPSGLGCCRVHGADAGIVDQGVSHAGFAPKWPSHRRRSPALAGSRRGSRRTGTERGPPPRASNAADGLGSRLGNAPVW